MGIVVSFPGAAKVSPTEATEEPVRWQVRCGCGSTDFHIFACGEILCGHCEDVVTNAGRGDIRAHWTGETTLVPLQAPFDPFSEQA